MQSLTWTIFCAVLFVVSMEWAQAQTFSTTTGNIRANDMEYFTTVTSLGSVSSGTVKIEWGTSTSYGRDYQWTISSPQTVGGIAFPMTCGTVYHYRGCFTSSAGTSCGPDQTASTLSCNTLATLAATTPTNVTSYSADFNGNMTSLGVGSSTAWGAFQFGDTAANVASHSSTPVSMTATGTLSSTGNWPCNWTQVYYRSVTGNSAGNDFGATQSMTVSPCTPPTHNSTGVDFITTSMVEFNTNITSLGNAPWVSIHARYGQSLNSMTTIPFNDVAVTGVVRNIAFNVTCGVQHYYYLEVYSPAGTATSTTQTFTLPCSGVAPTVGTNAPSAVKMTSATLEGALTNFGLYPLQMFAVGFKFNNAGSTSWYWASPTPTSAAPFSEPITGLACNTNYSYEAYANAQLHLGTIYGPSVSFKTLPCPASIQTITASTVHATGAVLNGSVTNPGAGNSAGTQVSFEWGLTTNYGLSGAASSPTVATTGSFNRPQALACNKTYHFRAVGTTVSGTFYGQDQTVQTGACSSWNPGTSASDLADLIRKPEYADIKLGLDNGGVSHTDDADNLEDTYLQMAPAPMHPMPEEINQNLDFAQAAWASDENFIFVQVPSYDGEEMCEMVFSAQEHSWHWSEETCH